MIGCTMWRLACWHALAFGYLAFQSAMPYSLKIQTIFNFATTFLLWKNKILEIKKKKERKKENKACLYYQEKTLKILTHFIKYSVFTGNTHSGGIYNFLCEIKDTIILINLVSLWVSRRC